MSVGARVDDEGWCGPLGSPAGWGVAVFPQDVSEMNRTRATLKALPTHHPPLSPLQMLTGLFFG